MDQQEVSTDDVQGEDVEAAALASRLIEAEYPNAPIEERRAYLLRFLTTGLAVAIFRCLKSDMKASN